MGIVVKISRSINLSVHKIRRMKKCFGQFKIAAFDLINKNTLLQKKRWRISNAYKHCEAILDGII